MTTDPIVLLGWFLATPIVLFFGSAAFAAIWLSYLAYRRVRTGRRAIVKLDNALAIGAERGYESEEFDRALDRARAACGRVGLADRKYYEACELLRVDP